MLRIGEFSKLSRVSIRMLRHYDEIGLMIPEMVDEFTGYRYYGEAQLPVMNRITALKDMGFSLATISEILKCYKDPEALKQYLIIRQSEITGEVQEMSRRLKLLDTIINRLGKDEAVMKYDVTLKTLPERTVASVRKIIPSYQHEGMLWQILMEETGPLKLQEDSPCYTLAIFHDGEYKEQDVDVEVQKSIKGNYPNTENVVFKKVPPIQMASAIFKGSYDQTSEVNEEVVNWIRDNDYEMDGLSFFIYHVSPHEAQNPEQLVTEVCYPVRKKC